MRSMVPSPPRPRRGRGDRRRGGRRRRRGRPGRGPRRPRPGARRRGRCSIEPARAASARHGGLGAARGARAARRVRIGPRRASRLDRRARPTASRSTADPASRRRRARGRGAGTRRCRRRPASGETMAPMMVAPRPARAAPTSPSTSAPHVGVADHAPARRHLGPPGLELGLDQQDQVGRRATQTPSRRRRTVRSEMKDRSATTTSAGGSTSPGRERRGRWSARAPRPGGRRAAARGAGRSRRRRRPPRGAPLEAAVGEAAGRRAGVEDPASGDVDAEAVEGGVELLAAAAHEAGRGRRRAGSARRAPTRRAGLAAGAPPTMTRPAAISWPGPLPAGDQAPADQLGVEPAAGGSWPQPAAFLAGGLLAPAAFFAGAFLAGGLLGRRPSSPGPSWPRPSSPGPSWPRPSSRPAGCRWRCARSVALAAASSCTWAAEGLDLLLEALDGVLGDGLEQRQLAAHLVWITRHSCSAFARLRSTSSSTTSPACFRLDLTRLHQLLHDRLGRVTGELGELRRRRRCSGWSGFLGHAGDGYDRLPRCLQKQARRHGHADEQRRPAAARSAATRSGVGHDGQLVDAR